MDVANFELDEAVDGGVRFMTVGTEEKERLLDNLDSDNTKKSTKRSVKLFREWLAASGRELDFENLPAAQINDMLSKFWYELRTNKNERYSRSSMMNIRNGLNRHLQECRRKSGEPPIDILNDTEFKLGSNIDFRAVNKELKRVGKGDIKHHEPLSEADMRLCYKYFGKSCRTNSLTLQEKVYFDVVLHLIRRGRENIRILTTDHFAIATDSNGARYLYQRLDESTKNHQDDTDSGRNAGRIYDIPFSNLCPVATYEFYVSKLDPESKQLFQTPKKQHQPTDAVWYKRTPLGHNSIGELMPTISKKAALSKRYTNHCLRATSITILDGKNFATRHIMSVSGHKAESSLKSYSRHTSEEIQESMSRTLSSSLGLNAFKENTAPSSSYTVSRLPDHDRSDDVVSESAATVSNHPPSTGSLSALSPAVSHGSLASDPVTLSYTEHIAPVTLNDQPATCSDSSTCNMELQSVIDTSNISNVVDIPDDVLANMPMPQNTVYNLSTAPNISNCSVVINYNFNVK